MIMLASQPQTVGKVLDDGFKFYRSTLTQILPLSFLAVFVPIVVMVSFIGPSNYFNLVSGQMDPATTDFASLFTSLGVGAVLAMFLAIIFYAAIFYKMSGAALGDSLNFGGAMSLGLKAAIPLLITGILYMLVVSVGFALLVIPGIILMVSMMLYMPAYTMDNEGIIGCLKKSHNLVWGNWWRTVLIFSIPTIILMVVYMGFGVVAGILIAFSGAEGDLFTYQIIIEIVQYSFNVFLTPMFPAFMIILYHDLKLRKEGGDLDAKIASTT